MWRDHRSDRKGFTLIELMIVVVVIGILAALAIPSFADTAREAKEAETRPMLKQIYTLEYRHQAGNSDFTDDITLLEGGATLAGAGKYFTMSIIPHASGFCVVATPNAAGVASGLDPQSLDADGVYHETNGC